MVEGAVKEGEGGYVAVDGKNFGEEIGGFDQAGEEDKAEKVLAHPLLQPVETHVYRLGLLRANRGSCKTDSTFVIDKKKGRRLLGVAKVGECERELSQPSQSTHRQSQTKPSKDTVPYSCPPPHPITPILFAPYPHSPQCTSPRLLPAHTRGGCVCGRGGVCRHFWWWAGVVGGRVSEANRAASYAARVRSGQEAGVGTAPESHGGRVKSVLGVGVRGDIVEKAVSGGKV
jgi:hypothetical protein